MPQPSADRFDEAYFRQLYGEIPAQTPFDRARDARIVHLVHRHARPGGALLDIGCGYGFLLGRFRGRHRLVGIELSHHAGSTAREGAAGAAGARLVRADVEGGLPFRRTFEVVLAVNVIEHLREPASAVASIREILLPGGLCVVHLPTVSGPFSRAIYRLAYAQDPTHIYRPSAREVDRLFASEGFELLESSHAPHAPKIVARRLTGSPAYLAAFRAP
ncbi:MAG TPA: class I SAM-dependent methyltransferase [Actinomycetota bacterium]|nr:class I SAM-dependent methyltransferase [Actinomycetota bacterium]